jgi:hypothetical protein
MRILFSAGFVLCLLAGGAAVAADGYEIRLNRPFEKGDRFRMSATGKLTNSTIVTRDDEVVRRDDLSISVELQALVEILEVDERGRPLKESLGIEFLVYGSGSTPTEALPTGEVIIAETVGERTEFRLLNGRLPAMARSALQIIVGTYTGDVPDDDLIFGSTDLQSVGASWGVNAEAFARAMRANGVVLAAGGLKGKVTLLGVEQVGGVECLRVNATVAVDGLSMTDLPDGVEQQSGSAEVLVTGLFPTDLGRVRMHDSKTVSMELVVANHRGPMAGMVLHSSSVRSGEKTMIPYPRRPVSGGIADEAVRSD